MNARHSQQALKFNDLQHRLSTAQERFRAGMLSQRYKCSRKDALTASARGRPSILSLSYPPVEYRPERAFHNQTTFFEARFDSIRQTLIRVESLLDSSLRKKDRRRALKLADRLLTAIERDIPAPSLASSLFMREARIRVIGALWQLHDQLSHIPRAVFTLIPRGFSLTEAELRRFDLKKAMEALRGALRRAGASKAAGCLILFLHAEWDENTQRYQLHFHGWAAGDMIKVVRALRKQRRFAGAKQARVGDIDGVRCRVRISRKPILNPAYRLSYILQPFWPARRTGETTHLVDEQSRRYRQRAKHRIPEPQHAKHLIWLDRWSIEDISLRIGLDVFRGELRCKYAGGLSNNRGQ